MIYRIFAIRRRGYYLFHRAIFCGHYSRAATNRGSLAKPDPSAKREGLVRSLCHVLYRWNVCGYITHNEYDYVKLCMFVIAVKGVATTAMEPYSPPVLRQFVKHKKDTHAKQRLSPYPVGSTANTLQNCQLLRLQVVITKLLRCTSSGVSLSASQTIHVLSPYSLYAIKL